ncbi:MAG: Uncharacterized protein FD166_3711, partial [Bacteroidetes bacterium]
SIAKTAATMGFPAAIPFIAIAAAVGALQALAIAAKPLPAYKHGRNGGPAEWALVGEEGSEGIVYPSGQTAITPDKSTLTFLPAGASVIPHKDLVAHPGLFVDRTVSRMPERFSTRALEDKLDRGFNQLSETVRNKQEHFWNFSENGIQHLVRNGQAWTRYLNKKHRS